MKASVVAKCINKSLHQQSSSRHLLERFLSNQGNCFIQTNKHNWNRWNLPSIVYSKTRFFSSSSKTSNQNTNAKERLEAKHVLPPAEKARSLIASRKSGTLTTVSLEENKREDIPPLYGSLMPYVVLPQTGVDEMHYQHITNYPRGSFLVFPVTPVNIPPSEVPVPRLNFTGNIVALDDSLARIAREKFLERHPAAKPFFEQSEFKFYQFQPTEIYFLGALEFGKTEVIGLDEYNNARPDPLSSQTLKLLQDIHKEYQKDLHLLYREYGDGTTVDPTSVFIFFIDRLGFNLLARVENDNRWLELRLPYPYEIHTYETCLSGIASSLETLKNEKYSLNVDK